MAFIHLMVSEKGFSTRYHTGNSYADTEGHVGNGKVRREHSWCVRTCKLWVGREHRMHEWETRTEGETGQITIQPYRPSRGDWTSS